MHTFKRIYLIGAIIISLSIPYITFTQYIEPEIALEANLLESRIIESSETINQEKNYENNINIQKQTDYLTSVLWIIYGLGVLVFGIKFIVNLSYLIKKIRQNPKHKIQNFTHVLLQNLIAPHTFFNYLFLNKVKYEANLIPQEVLWHEQTHAQEKHSLDVLFIELLHATFWFNPLFYYLKKSIKLNHEFLADRAVLNKGVSLTAYQEILLTFTTNSTESQLANAINYSSIKKRLTIMKTKTSKKTIWLKSLVLLPLLSILIYSFSNKVIAQKENQPNKSIQDEIEAIDKLEVHYLKNEEGISNKLMKEYNHFINSYNKTHTIHSNKYHRVIAIYDLMSKKQKESVDPLPKNILTIDLSKTKTRKPTLIQFNSWKDSRTFAIWIDNKHVNNNLLNKYNINDIVYFSGSFVHKNARSKKFPQTYQYDLFTAKGFEETYTKSNINTYNNLRANYVKEINAFFKTNKKNDSELRIKKSRIDRVYKQFTQKEIDKYKILKTPPIPNKKIDFSNNKITIAENIIINIDANGKLLLNETPVKIENLTNRLNEINSWLSFEQKKELVLAKILVTPKTQMGFLTDVKIKLRTYGTFKTSIEYVLPLQPQQKATPEQIAEYNTLAKHYNSQSKEKMIIKLKDMKRIKYLYDLMTDDQKKNNEPFPNFPPPPAPIPVAKKGESPQMAISKTFYTYIDENGKEINVELVHDGLQLVPAIPPPPPIPANTTESQKKNYESAIHKYEGNKKQQIEKFNSDLEKIKNETAKNNTDKNGSFLIKGKTYYYKTKDGITKYYDKFGNEVDRNSGNPLPPAPPIKIDINSGNPLPPPSPLPPNPIDHMIELAKKDADFYYNGKKISSDKAIDIAKNNKDINIQIREHNSDKPVVKLTSKTFLIKNKTESASKPLPKDVNYYIDSKNVSLKQINELNADTILEINVKQKKGPKKGEIHITTKK